MPVPIGFLTFPEVYSRHYTNRFVAVPTTTDAAKVSLCFGADRADARKLLDDEILDRPTELTRWRSFVDQQSEVGSDIIGALVDGGLIAFVGDNKDRITSQEWQVLADSINFDLFTVGALRSASLNPFPQHHSCWRLLNQYPYVNEDACQAWSGRTASSKKVALGPAVRAHEQALIAEFPDPGPGPYSHEWAIKYLKDWETEFLAEKRPRTTTRKWKSFASALGVSNPKATAAWKAAKLGRGFRGGVGRPPKAKMV